MTNDEVIIVTNKPHTNFSNALFIYMLNLSFATLILYFIYPYFQCWYISLAKQKSTLPSALSWKLDFTLRLRKRNDCIFVNLSSKLAVSRSRLSGSRSILKRVFWRIVITTASRRLTLSTAARGFTRASRWLRTRCGLLVILFRGFFLGFFNCRLLFRLL